MKKTRLIIIVLLTSAVFNTAWAQEEDLEEKKGFRKENLFTGGSISLGFSTNTFQVGANPFFGYSVAKWMDAGLVVNFNYASFRNVFITDPNDKIRETTYGGGVFTRLYPVRFLFAQAQFEHNFITEKFIPGNGGTSAKNKVEANSLLVGAGYTSERYPGSGSPFFYLSVLFDVLDNEYSPYRRSGGGVMPIIRAGFQVPLFQGSRGRY
jgi:hypothetical protein